VVVARRDVGREGTERVEGRLVQTASSRSMFSLIGCMDVGRASIMTCAYSPRRPSSTLRGRVGTEPHRSSAVERDEDHRPARRRRRAAMISQISRKWV